MRPPTRRVRTGGTVRLAHAGVTDVGRVRESNQDDFGSVDGIVVLADGMGGHRGGEVAAAEAVAATLEGFSIQTRQGLAGAVLAANRAVLVRAAGDPHLSGMGTTICALAIVVGEDGDAQATSEEVWDGVEELYDFLSDRGEERDLSNDAAHRETRARMSATVDQLLKAK